MSSNPSSETNRTVHAECTITLQDLAAFAYASKLGGIEDERFAVIGSHLENCEPCQKHLSVLYATDPFLANEALPPLKFLEHEQALSRVAEIAVDLADKHHDPDVSAIIRLSLRDLLSNQTTEEQQRSQKI